MEGRSTKVYGYIARDKDERLHLFRSKPSRFKDIWQDAEGQTTSIDCSEFPELSWHKYPIVFAIRNDNKIKKVNE